MKTKQQTYPKLAEALGAPEVYLKREDKHKYGSHKGRSIPLMIKEYHRQGWKDFVISSSGNAALAAILAIDSNNRNKPNDQLNLKVFVGQNIDSNKLEILKSKIEKSEDQKIAIEQVERPKQMAFQLDKDGKAKNLRQSTDDTSLEGYYDLAKELDKIPDLQAIFVPTSSGTTAQGLGEAFIKLKNKSQIHIIQTEACHPIANVFNPIGVAPARMSIASAIVDKVAHRKDKVIEIIKNSQGSGWIVSDDEIKNAMQLIKETTGLTISPNSALSVAGLKKALDNDFKFDGPVVCLITGQ
ncbi:PLP-dependent lyase/thiolase [Patescibacteria group bacterium]|nr:PLP-dependent lyase/thiolase [Patescibacteria group bacterium]MBU1895623.1 PLP-dependent lyase/thiolase [Patescibacteria group bacterium]